MIVRAATAIAKPFLIEWAIRRAIAYGARDARAVWWLKRIASGSVRLRACASIILLASICAFGVQVLLCVHAITAWWLLAIAIVACALILGIVVLAAIAWYLAWIAADWVIPAVLAVDPSWRPPPGFRRSGG